MELLASGPCALDSGPVGRCSSRGWIRYIALDESKRGIYALTPSGHAQLDETLDQHSNSGWKDKIATPLEQISRSRAWSWFCKPPSTASGRSPIRTSNRK